MVEIVIAYEGELHCTATHRPSGTTLATDAPKDNRGKGESFSPTDLLATALGSCVLTVMGIAARGMRVELAGACAVVVKDMVAAPVRRVGALRVRIHLPVVVTAEQRTTLEAAAWACPVHKSLHPDIHVQMEFEWA